MSEVGFTILSMSIDPTLRSFIESFRAIQRLADQLQPEDDGVPLADELTKHLGDRANGLAVVSKTMPAYRYADFDVALEHLAGSSSRCIGVGGGDARQHMSFSDMLSNPWQRIVVGQVDWKNAPVSPTETRRIVQLGVRLFTFEGFPVVVFQRGPCDSHLNEGVVEVLSLDPDRSNRLIDRVQELSVEHSLLRGNVISLQMVGYDGEGDGYRFMERPEVPASDVILPPGRLERIVAHIEGIAKHRDTLQEYGQHLKRGILLYGPPGTGKTHTIRHLLSITPDHTVIVLSGRTLELIGQATSIAKKLEPSIVVLEDCDLVAMSRGLFSGPANPLLFEVLDALDGLEPASDVAFLLTTNRVDVLEGALTQRPGRIDLAVEIPRPDADARLKLLRLYAKDIPFSESVLKSIAERADAETASFFKELIRRAVLLAAASGQSPSDDHLQTALDELLTNNATLTQSLLGGNTEFDFSNDHYL